MRYHFGTFTLDPRERRLLHNSDPVSLTPKVFDTLVYLVERHGRLVGKDELLTAIWADANVEEGSLPRTIHILRKKLTAGEDKELQRQYIETIPTKGYRFAADVTTLAAGRLLPVRPVAAGARWRWLAAAALLILALAGAAWAALDQRNLSSLLGLRRRAPPTDSGAAYAKFQSGRVHLERRLPGDIETALADFEAAIQLDPAFSAAHAGEAEARLARYWGTGAHDNTAQARLAVRKAIELDGKSSYAHSLRCGLQAIYDWEFAGAETECRLAVQLDPRIRKPEGNSRSL